ncbi:hypothetical protein H4R19_000357 [Coemansia spiralis]|nr:hypothetical protein H4R19_000357 [Coemansia spiralis]
MNQLELEMLFLIKFDLKVDTAELQSIGEWLVGRPPVLAGHWAPLELFAPHTDYAARLQQQMQQQQQLPTPDFAPTPDRLQGVVSPLELARCASHRRKPSSRDLRRQKQCRAPAPDAVLATPCSIDTGSPSCEIHHSCVASSACSEMHGPVSPPGLLDGAQGAQRHRRRRTSGMHAAPPAAVNIGFTADADRRHA